MGYLIGVVIFGLIVVYAMFRDDKNAEKDAQKAANECWRDWKRRHR